MVNINDLLQLGLLQQQGTLQQGGFNIDPQQQALLGAGQQGLLAFEQGQGGPGVFGNLIGGLLDTQTRVQGQQTQALQNVLGTAQTVGNLQAQQLEQQQLVQAEAQRAQIGGILSGPGTLDEKANLLFRLGDDESIKLGTELQERAIQTGERVQKTKLEIGKREDSLRDDFTTQVDRSGFLDQLGGFQRIKSVAKLGTAAGDLALVFNFMKVQDPGSVVRESEFRTAQDAKAWLSRSDEQGIVIPSFIRTAIQKAGTGAFLLPEQRKDFVKTAGEVFKSAKRQNNQLKSEFRRIAKETGLSPKNVIIQFQPPPVPEPEPRTEIPGLPDLGGALPSLPRGAVQIGTSGGLPVFETPDGRRFIQE